MAHRVQLHASVRIVLLIGLFLLASISAVQGARNVHTFSHDFQWDAARLIVERTNPYALFLEASATGQPIYVEDAAGNLEPNQFPSLLFLLTPYALLPWTVAKWAWFATNIIATAIILILARRRSSTLQPMFPFVLFCLVLITATPWRMIVGLGQHSLVALACFMMAVDLAERRHPWLGGILYAASLFKYTITAPLGLYFCYKRDFRPLLVAAFLHLTVHLGMSMWLDTSPVALIREPLRVANLVVANQGYIDLMALSHLVELPQAVAIVLAGAITVGALWVLLRLSSTCTNDICVLALLALLSNLIVYHRTYDLITLLFLMLLLLEIKTVPRVIQYSSILLLLTGWYGIRVVQQFESTMPTIEPLFRLVLAVLCYGTFFTLLLHLWRHNAPRNKPIESLPPAPRRW